MLTPQSRQKLHRISSTRGGVWTNLGSCTAKLVPHCQRRLHLHVQGPSWIDRLFQPRLFENGDVPLTHSTSIGTVPVMLPQVSPQYRQTWFHARPCREALLARPCPDLRRRQLTRAPASCAEAGYLGRSDLLDPELSRPQPRRSPASQTLGVVFDDSLAGPATREVQ